MSFSLYELSAEAASLLADIDLMDSSGEYSEAEIDAKIEEYLDIKDLAADKIRNWCALIALFKARAGALKAEKDTLAAKQKTQERKYTFMTARLLDALLVMGETKMAAGNFNLRVQSSKSVNVFAPELVPDKYLEAQEPKILKTELLRDLKQGDEIPGATIDERSFLVIR